MTKQDYIALAEAIQAAQSAVEARYANAGDTSHSADEWAGGLAALNHAAEEIASVLARDNSRFDRERFLAAALKGEWTNAPGHANTRNGKR